jgi:DNA-binding CsgD family transcriptional regulator
MAAISDQTARLDALTLKQREVLRMVAEGLTSKEIARKLGISESAVNQRIETIRQRLGGLPRSQIARLYRHQNTLLITLPTSNSLTGKPIQLQVDGDTIQPSSSEGAVDLVDPGFIETDGVLQPSTFSFARTSSEVVLVRLGLVVGTAFGFAAILVLLLDAAEKLARMTN